MKLIFSLSLLLFSFCYEATAQACGYSYAKFFVTNLAGEAIRNARFEFLEKDSSEVAIHSNKELRWSEEKGSYFLSEGMCGGHRDVRVKITASGFETLERIVDLPLTNAEYPLIYRISLKKNGSDQAASFEYLSRLKGTVFDANGSVVVKAQITAVSSSGRKFEGFSNENGEYELILPFNRYDQSRSFREAKFDIITQSPGFKKSEIRGFVFIPSQFGRMHLDIALELGPVSDELHP